MWLNNKSELNYWLLEMNSTKGTACKTDRIPPKTGVFRGEWIALNAVIKKEERSEDKATEH